MKKREFRQTSRTGKTRVWTIEVEGKYVRTTYGELGGKMQEVVDEGQRKNKGRKNEVTPEEDAIYLAKRAILKKTRSGYRPVGAKAENAIDWLGKSIPESLRFYKPNNSLSKTVKSLIELDRALLTRKRDGEMMVLVKWADGSADIFSRTMLPHHHREAGQYTWSDRFPKLIQEIEEEDLVPPCSMLLGDVVSDPRERDRWEIASFMKSKTEAVQDSLPPFFYCWDIAFWDQEDLITSFPFQERYDLIQGVWGRVWSGSTWVLPVEIFKPSDVFAFVKDVVDKDPASTRAKAGSYIETAMEFAKNAGWEGWVAVDPEAIIGDKAYNFRGKTDRPSKASCKVKPIFEGDFVAYFDPDKKQGKWGRGKHRGEVGSVSLYQYNTEGKLIYICDCGGGIDDNFRELYSSPSTYPLVLEVEYSERTFISEGAKTNALTFPRVSRVRYDKTPDECVEPRL